MSQLWKIPFILIMIIYVFRYKFQTKSFIKVSYAFSLSKLLNYSILNNFVGQVVECFRFMNLPLLYDASSRFFKRSNSSKIFSILIRFAQYTILSFIPFILGILEERVAYADNEILESYQNSVGAHAGIFQNPHGASIIVSLSLIVLIYYIKNVRINRRLLIINFLIVLLGIFILYTTYVRTGYIVFLGGLLILLLPKKLKVKDLIIIFLSISTLYISYEYLMDHNHFFRARILDLDEYGNEREVGSGRLNIWQNSIELWWNSERTFDFLFGYGLSGVKDFQEMKTGMRVFSHNGYIDALAQNGLVGLTLMLSFYILVFRRIRQCKYVQSYSLAMSMFISTLIIQMFQGGVGFLNDLFFVFILIVMEKENIERIQLKSNLKIYE